MKIPQSIETERLLIRRYVAEDLEGLHRFFNNEKITSLMDMPLYRSLEETKEFLDILIGSYNTDEPLFIMAICRKDNGDVVGSCGFAALDIINDCQMYYVLDPTHTGKGYATEAVEKMLEYMMIVMDIKRISIFCSPQNKASMKLAEKVGMQYQGVFKNDEMDKAYYLLTREMYFLGN